MFFSTLPTGAHLLNLLCWSVRDIGGGGRGGDYEQVHTLLLINKYSASSKARQLGLYMYISQIAAFVSKPSLQFACCAGQS